MKNQQGNFGPILPIADTVSGMQARENPQGTVHHYQSLQTQLWLSPKVRDVADGMLSHVQQGRTAWGSLSGPYGFGKTAAAISLWTHARNEGFLAIPPLSCTNFDELAYGIVALAGVQAPKMKRQIQTCFWEVWTEGLDHAVQTDAKRYDVSARKVRQIFQDKLRSGQFTLDSHPYRLVEFLAKLGQLATEFSNGLIIILDEIQQLLGPLDARAIVRFREFVWGMRTERSHCGVILALDSLLEARLSRWAADVLHRIRENGPTLQLTDVYTREFPFWLWERLTNTHEKDKRCLPRAALTEEVLVSLGQLVERPDLTNGPRTVIEVFSRATIYHNKTGKSYDIPELIEDVHQGQFRYFGEGATIQNVLTQVLSDEWVLQDEGRQILVRTLAAFPFGCPQKTLQLYLPEREQLERATEELFGPLLVELKDGLALELLQQVRRTQSNWERILWRCWETLPALDVLAIHVPDMVQRILIPRLFPKGNPAAPMWEQLSDDFSTVLEGWRILRGTFDDAYPQREIALCVTDKEPNSWPQDVDICIALICNASTEIDVNPRAELRDVGSVICLVLTLPALRPLTDGLPADLQRYHKYIQPEPFRPATILTALHELEALLGNLTDNGSDASETHSSEDDSEVRRVKAFVKMSVDFVLRELLRGTVDIESGLRYSCGDQSCCVPYLARDAAVASHNTRR